MGVSAPTRNIVLTAFGPFNSSFIKTTFRGDVRFNPNNWFYTCLTRLLIKFKGPKYISVIGNCNGWHLLTSNLFDQLFNARSTIEHRILGVDVKVDEV